MSNPITISIVDDKAELCDRITAFLNAQPGFHCVSSYTSADDALQKLGRDRPDVVLMDINLGAGSSGIDCIVQLKEQLPAAQFLMLTVFEDTEKIFKALTSGASGYLLKRMPPAKLVEAIHEVMDGGSPMSAPIARKVVQLLNKIPSRGDAKVELAARERELLDHLTAGRSYKQIADHMNITIHTVRTYIRRIYEKLHVQSRTEAVVKYLKQ